MRKFLTIATCLFLTACPQAGQFLTPQPHQAAAPTEEGGDEGEVSPPAPENPFHYTLREPIDPKSDTPNIRIISFVDARLRWGTDYSLILPKAPPMLYFLDRGSETTSLTFVLEVMFPGMKSDGADDPLWIRASLPPNGQGFAVRLVFQPDGQPASAAVYCDALWITNSAGEAFLSFPNLPLGPGEVSFYLYQKILMVSGELQIEQPTDFHTGGLVPLTTGDPRKPFPSEPESSAVHRLGSFQFLQFIRMTPLFSP